MLNEYMSSNDSGNNENENEPYNYPENNFVGTNDLSITNVETKEFRYKEDYMSFLKEDTEFSVITAKPSLVFVFVPKADDDEITALRCLLPFANINLFKDIHLYVRYKMIRPPSDFKLFKKSIADLCEEFTNPVTAIREFIHPNTGAKIIEKIRTKSDTPFIFHDDEVEPWTLDDILETCSKQPTLLYLLCHGSHGSVTIGDGFTDREKLFPKSEPFLTKAKTVPDIPLIIVSKMCGGQDFVTNEMLDEKNIKNVKYITLDTDECRNKFEYDETFATMWLTTMYFKEEGEDKKTVGKPLLLDTERAVEKYNSTISEPKKKLRIHQNGKPFRFKPSDIPWDAMIHTDDLDTVDKDGEQFIGGVAYYKSIPTMTGPVNSSSSSASTSRRTTSRRSKSRRSTRRSSRSTRRRRTRRNRF